MSIRPPFLSTTLGGALSLALAACGGGGSDSDTTPPPNPIVTLNGSVMVDQAIRNAIVCMDLNANGICDSGEPASARTGADGAYTLTYDNTKLSSAQVAAASLIASMVPGAVSAETTTIDAADLSTGNTAKAYVLRQVPGKSGQINPLTTLLAAGIAAGMTEATARSNIAVQLAIAESKIDNYQDEPATGGDVRDGARLMAQIVAAAAEAGAKLEVGDQQAAVAASSGDLANLRYTDATNYSYRTLDIAAKAAGGSGGQLLDQRAGKTAGANASADTLYPQAYLTPTGWLRCDASVPIPATAGLPNRSTFCGALQQAGFYAPQNIETLSMASLVDQLQTDSTSNTLNSGMATANLTAALAASVFPTGALLNTRINMALTQPVMINNLGTDGRPQAEATTLEQLIAKKPAAAVVLSKGSGTLGLGSSTGATRALRVAFTGTTSATAGTVQFYECDLSSDQTTISNCSTTQTGTYAIASVHGTRVMRFAGHAPTTMTHSRVYTEVANAPTLATGSWVYQARESKADATSSLVINKRLNPVAWAAMKTQLAL